MAGVDAMQPLSKLTKLEVPLSNDSAHAPRLFIKKLSEHAITPSCCSTFVARYDISSAYDDVVPTGGKALIKMNLSIAILEGTYARLAPRSGLAWKHSIDVGVGVIDADYRGPIGVILFNFSDRDFPVKADN